VTVAPREAVERRRTFDGLYRRHRAEIYRAALRATGDRDEAEEVTQTAFLNAYRAWLRGESPREPRAWLFAIAENVRRRRWRDRARRPAQTTLGELPDVHADVDAPSGREIGAALAELPEHQRAAIVLREIGGLSYAEIARELELSVGSVQMLLFRARRTLRARLAPAGPLVALPPWLNGWPAWLGGSGPAARAAAAAGAVVLGLGAAGGGAPPSEARAVPPPDDVGADCCDISFEAAPGVSPVTRAAGEPGATGGRRAAPAPATSPAPTPTRRPAPEPAPTLAESADPTPATTTTASAQPTDRPPPAAPSDPAGAVASRIAEAAPTQPLDELPALLPTLPAPPALQPPTPVELPPAPEVSLPDVPQPPAVADVPLPDLPAPPPVPEVNGGAPFILLP
jgi:RNA polymerase sigma-70 factor (ECF subfamily)